MQSGCRTGDPQRAALPVWAPNQKSETMPSFSQSP